jgi:hypothetical protein
MKRWIFLLLVLPLFALDDVTIPNTFTANTPAKASEVNENFDSLEVPYNKLLDTLDQNYTRFDDFADSTISAKRIDLDTLRGNPYIDTLMVQDTAWIDTLTVTKLKGTAANFSGVCTSATVNTGQGNNEVYAMDQNVRTIDNVTFNKVTADTADADYITTDSIIALGSGGLALLEDGGSGIWVEDGGQVGVGTVSPVRDFHVYGATAILRVGQDGSGIDIYEGASYNGMDCVGSNKLAIRSKSTGDGDIIVDTTGYVGISTASPTATLDVTGSCAISGACTTATLNTGQGDNELYDMDQNVLTTSSVTFKKTDVADTLIAETVHTDGLVIVETGGAGIVNNEITVDDSTSYIRVTNEGLVSADSISTINGGKPGQILIIAQGNGGGETTLLDGGMGNDKLQLNGNYIVDNSTASHIVLIRHTSYSDFWVELSRSGWDP